MPDDYRSNTEDEYHWTVYDHDGDVVGTVTTDLNNIHDAQQEARDEYGNDTYTIRPS